jgi:hypothetical protein
MMIWFRERHEIRPPSDHQISARLDVDVTDVLLDQFEDVIPIDRIESVAIDLEMMGAWVSVGIPSRKMRMSKLKATSSIFSFFSPRALQARLNVATRLTELENAIADLRGRTNAFGHNGAPRDPTDAPEFPSIYELEAATLELRTQERSGAPSAKKISSATRRLSRWARVWRWVLEKANTTADAGSKAFGAALGTGLALFVLGNCPALMHSVVDHVEAVVAAANEWIREAQIGETGADDQPPREHPQELAGRAATKKTAPRQSQQPS